MPCWQAPVDGLALACPTYVAAPAPSHGATSERNPAPHARRLPRGARPDLRPAGRDDPAGRLGHQPRDHGRSSTPTCRLAESVIAADEQIDAIQRGLDEASIDLLARQQPVATDLRIVVTGMRMSADLERMGDLARHVAKVARLRYPDSAIPPVLRATVLEMGQVAERIVAKAGSVIASKDVDAALLLEKDDDADGRAAPAGLHRRCSATTGRYGIEAAVDVTLIGRYYERFADHAVSVARRVVYLVTGEWQDAYVVANGSTEASLSSRSAQRPWFATAGSRPRPRRPGRGTRRRAAVGLQVGVQLVDQRDAGRDVQAGDVGLGDAVEVLDQRAQAVAVGGDQHGLAGPQVRDDRDSQ